MSYANFLFLKSLFFTYKEFLKYFFTIVKNNHPLKKRLSPGTSPAAYFFWYFAVCGEYYFCFISRHGTAGEHGL